MDDRQTFTRDVLQLICEEEDDEGPPEIGLTCTQL